MPRNAWASLENHIEMLLFNLENKDIKNYNLHQNFIDCLRKLSIISSLPVLMGGGGGGGGGHPKYWYSITWNIYTWLWIIVNFCILNINLVTFTINFILRRKCEIWRFQQWKIKNMGMKAWRSIIMSDTKNLYLLPQRFLRLKIKFFLSLRTLSFFVAHRFSLSHSMRDVTPTPFYLLNK